MLSPPESPPARRELKIALILLVVAMLVAAHQTGVLRQFGDPAEVKRTLVGLGPWGYAAFIAAYTALQPFGVPGTVFVWAAPLIWPWQIAFVLSMTGTMTASVVGFSFSRFIARDWVAARLPPRFAKYDDALRRRAFATVFVLRFVFWMPQVLHAFFGVSQVPFWTHFWGSLAGYFVPLLLVSYFGPQLFDWLRAQPPSVWIGLGAATALGVFAWRLHRRRTRVARGSEPT